MENAPVAPPTTQEPIKKEWKATCLENQDNVTIDDLKFIFGQAEKRLDDGIKNFDATTTKSISFITLSATLLTAMAAYLFINIDPDGVFSEKLCTVSLCCVYTAYVLYRFVGIILPKTYQPIGSFPQDLYINSMFESPAPTSGNRVNENTLYLYLTEIQSYNKRILANAEKNTARLDVFTRSAKQICAMPIIGLLVYFLLVLVSRFGSSF